MRNNAPTVGISQKSTASLTAPTAGRECMEVQYNETLL